MIEEQPPQSRETIRTPGNVPSPAEIRDGDIEKKIKREVSELWKLKNPPVKAIFTERSRRGVVSGVVKQADGQEIKVFVGESSYHHLLIGDDDLNKPIEVMFALPMLEFKGAHYHGSTRGCVYKYKQPFELDNELAKRLAVNGASAEVIVDVF